MRTTLLGVTGVEVGRLGLGTAQFGSWSGTGFEQDARVIHAALDAGVNLIDTADAYSAGEAEEILGRALRGRRDEVVVASKFSRPVGEARPNRQGGSRRWIVRAVEDSLRRLRTDWIDLYQVHWFNHDCDVDETLGALSDLVHQGKIRMIGSSVFPPEWIVESQWVAERRGRERIVCEQAPYSLFARRPEISVLPTCRRHRVSVMVHQALNGGWLTGKYRADASVPSGSRADVWPHGRSRFDRERPEVRSKLAALDRLDPLAAEAGCSLAELALAFVLRHPAVDVALVGARSTEQLAGLLAGAELELDERLLDALDEVVAPGENLDEEDHTVAYAEPGRGRAARR